MSAFPSSRAICALLADDSVKAVLLLTLAWAATRLAHRRSAALRHHVWALAIVGTLLLPVLPFAVPVWRAPGGSAASKLLVAALSLEPGSSITTVNAVFDPPQAIHWSTWIVGLWLAGAGLMVARMMVAWLALTRASIHAAPAPAGVASRYSPDTCSPRT